VVWVDEDSVHNCTCSYCTGSPSGPDQPTATAVLVGATPPPATATAPWWMATSDMLICLPGAPDWAKNMEMCDICNHDPGYSPSPLPHPDSTRYGRGFDVDL